MKKQLATLLLVGLSGAVFAQGAQQQSGQSGAQQPRQQSGAQPGAQQPSQRQQSQVPTFDQADANKDGQLSRSEAGAIDGLDFSKADVNQNASIDRQEYTAAMASGSGSSEGSQRRGSDR